MGDFSTWQMYFIAWFKGLLAVVPDLAVPEHVHSHRIGHLNVLHDYNYCSVQLDTAAIHLEL